MAKKLRAHLHQIPELSGEEMKTKALLLHFLRKYTDLDITDMGSWFYAAHREASATESIAFRADMDAVIGPEGKPCHLCGHDGHCASLAGFGMATKGLNFGKNLFLIFQHGEETGEGGEICSRILAEREDIRKIFAYHNLPRQQLGTVCLRRGTFACASEGLILQFQGNPSHAAYPEDGHNPAYAISSLVTSLPSLADPVNYQDMVRCTVIHIHVGEPAFGVAPGSGRVLLTIRGAVEQDMYKLKKQIIKKSESLAAKEQLAFSWQETDVFPETRNDDECVTFLETICAAHSFPTTYLEEPHRWSEDFGWFLKRIPGAMLGIGSGTEQAPLHTENYEFPDEILETAIRLWLTIACEN
ncbi:MAG: M20/M25/M40 family metallo-hydrolase [Clostridiales bacterium]|nr:M20/M25/M40 family metallo-hydrolase [Clostridiales bacterium]